MKSASAGPTPAGGARRWREGTASSARGWRPSVSTTGVFVARISKEVSLLRLAATLTALYLLAACTGAEEPIRPDDVAGPLPWGAVSNVTHVGNLWFAGQPDAAALEEARRAGIGIVINLREAHEHDWDEKSAVEALGMIYYNVPIPKKRPFPTAAFAQIEALVEDNEDEQILIHCSTANRAAGWYATHLVVEGGMNLDDALAVGRRLGITKDAIVQNVASYLEEPPPAPASSPAEH